MGDFLSPLCMFLFRTRVNRTLPENKLIPTEAEARKGLRPETKINLKKAEKQQHFGEMREGQV